MTSRDDVDRVGAESSVESRALVPVLVAVCTIVAIVSSVGAPLIPTVAAAYGVSFTSAQWSLTIAMLVGAVTVPVLGRLGDGPFRRPVVLASLVVVLTGCLLSAIPGTFVLLVIGRGMQGVGLGLMPLAMAIARDHLPVKRARSCVAALSVTAVAGIGAGYPLTGVIAHYWGFHACFIVAASLTSIVLIGAVVTVPSSRHRPRHPLDAIGAVLLGLGLGLVLVALSTGGSWGWSSPRSIGSLVVGTILIGVWVRHELRSKYPLVQLRLLRDRSVLTADVTGLFAGVGMFVLSSSVIRFVQTPTDAGYGLGKSAMIAGLVLVPFSLASVCANKLLPLLARGVGVDAIMPIGALAFVVALLIFLLGRQDLWVVFVLMGVAGLGVGCTFAAMPTLIVGAVPAHETGSALGVNQVFRTMGGSIGSALSATVLAAFTAPGALLPADAGYTATAVISMVLWSTTAVIAFVLPRTARRRGAAKDVPEEPAHAIDRSGVR